LPKISEFFGISIYIYYADHPPPHFHAIYAGREAVIRIADLSVVEGKLPPRALGLVVEWATQRQEELAAVWKQAEAHEELSKIPPLE
jgi:hypothetical protein